MGAQDLSHPVVAKLREVGKDGTMTDEPQPKRGDAAWKQQRDEIAQRNAAVRKQAQVDQKTRDGFVEDQLREDNRRERELLQALNARIDSGKPGG